VVVVFGIIAKYGVDGLFMSTLMAGVLLLILGVTGLGTAVKFIPRPVVVGFTYLCTLGINISLLFKYLGLTYHDSMNQHGSPTRTDNPDPEARNTKEPIAPDLIALFRMTKRHCRYHRQHATEGFLWIED
jgi:hypothetical protein